MVGVVTGLAWTGPWGGELLTIEGVMIARQGQDDGHRATCVDVMKEVDLGGQRLTSAPPARSPFGIEPPDVRTRRDIHVHVPEGGDPEGTDRPPGVAMVTAIVSTLTGISGSQGRCHDRRDHAARPAILPIGGLKEKLLAGRTAAASRSC